MCDRACALLCVVTIACVARRDDAADGDADAALVARNRIATDDTTPRGKRAATAVSRLSATQVAQVGDVVRAHRASIDTTMSALRTEMQVSACAPLTCARVC
jgi:hypothetical protein